MDAGLDAHHPWLKGAAGYWSAAGGGVAAPRTLTPCAPGHSWPETGHLSYMLLNMTAHKRVVDGIRQAFEGGGDEVTDLRL